MDPSTVLKPETKTADFQVRLGQTQTGIDNISLSSYSTNTETFSRCPTCGETYQSLSCCPVCCSQGCYGSSISALQDPSYTRRQVCMCRKTHVTSSSCSYSLDSKNLNSNELKVPVQPLSKITEKTEKQSSIEIQGSICASDQSLPNSKYVQTPFSKADKLDQNNFNNHEIAEEKTFKEEKHYEWKSTDLPLLRSKSMYEMQTQTENFTSNIQIDVHNANSVMVTSSESEKGELLEPGSGFVRRNKNWYTSEHFKQADTFLQEMRDNEDFRYLHYVDYEYPFRPKKLSFLRQENKK